MKLIISQAVRAKLAGKARPVSEDEIAQCFANRQGKLLIDNREEHLTNPYTRWFIAETDYGRKLKVAYIPDKEGIIIKSAYDPNDQEMCIYERHGSAK